MAYQVFDTVAGANDILTKVRDVALANGWTVLENLTVDPSLDATVQNDGLRLTIKAPGDDACVACFRSANGKAIFPAQAGGGSGIGLICCQQYESAPASGFWYDQPQTPIEASTQNKVGVGIPVKPDSNYKLYVNVVATPKPMIVVSVEIIEGVFQHLAAGFVNKIGTWDGGVIFSGSRGASNMFISNFTRSAIESGSSHLFGMTKDVSTTFLRCDIDAAPLRANPVLWASNNTAGTTGHTGKVVGLPVKRLDSVGGTWNPQVPHYAFLQSQTSDDSGRNVNTLNCITVNLPLAVYVLRDPDGLKNFSQCGYIPGIYFISVRNVAAGKTYEISYPTSGQLHQAFPHVDRAGIFGYDGFSVKQ